MSKNPSIKSTESNLTRESATLIANGGNDASSHAAVSMSSQAHSLTISTTGAGDAGQVLPVDRPPSYVSRSNTPSMEPRDSTSAESGVIVSQPGTQAGWSHSNPSTLSAPGMFDMDFLLDVGQVVMHKQNLRLNQVFNPNAIQRMEMIDETRRILLHIEQDPPEDIEESFLFHLYNRHGKEVIRVLNPRSSVCVCGGATWHWLRGRRCRFQTVVYAPPGVVAGFVRRERTCFVQEYSILNPQEEVVLILRGGPTDLTIHSPDYSTEVGRLAARHWVGIMHEVRRSSEDIGLTFPIDLDVHFKSVLLGAILAIDWVINTEGGKKMPAPPSTREMKPSLQTSEIAAVNNVHDTESNIDSVHLQCSLDNESQREDARSRFSAEHRDLLTAEDFTNSSLRNNAGSRADIDNPSMDFTISDSAVCVETSEGGSIAENVSLVGNDRKRDP